MGVEWGAGATPLSAEFCFFQLTECTLFDDRMYPNCDRISPQAHLPWKYAIFSIGLHPFDHNSTKTLSTSIFVYSKA